MSVSTRCSHCGQVTEGPTWILGRTILCPHCREYFVAKALTNPRPADAGNNPERGASSKPYAPTVGEDLAATTEHSEPPAEPPGDHEKNPIRGDSTPPTSIGQDPAPCLGYIGRFVLRTYLGHGSYGSVYRAYDPVLDRDVALKVPKFSHDQPQKVRRFLAEAKAAARLRHPNLVAVYESGQAGDDLYIASEFVAGVPLSARLAEQPLGFRQAAQWLRDLALAVAYAHGQGIIHRDIKPANIMIDQSQRPQLMDFGLAKRLTDGADSPVSDGPGAHDPQQTVQGTVMGTPAYMAPEQARGDVKCVGPHSDQFSLGVVLYELLTRQLPFQGTPRQVIEQLLRKEPPRPRHINRRIPRTLEAICLRAMAKDPRQRYASAADLALDLQRWLTDESVQVRPFTPWERCWRWCRHNPSRAVLTAAAAAALLGALALSHFYLVSQRESMRRSLAAAQDDFGRKLRGLDQQHRVDNAQRDRQTSLVRCELERSTGLLRCAQGKPREGVLLLARAWSAAVHLGDAASRLAIADELLAATDSLPPLPEARLLPAPLQSRKAFRTGLWIDAPAEVIFIGLRARTPPGTGWAVVTNDGRSSRLCDAASGQELEPGAADDLEPVVLKVVTPPSRAREGPPRGTPGAIPLAAGSRVSGRALSPDGYTEAIVSQNMEQPGDRSATLEVWSFVPGSGTSGERGSPIRMGRASGVAATSVRFRPDGRGLLVWDNREARQWDVASFHALGEPFVHPELRSALFTPDSKYVVTCGARGACFWDAAAGRALFSLEYHGRFAQAVFSSDGQAFVTVHPDGLCFWPLFPLSLFSGERPEEIVHWAEVLTGMEFAANGRIRELDASTWRGRRRSFERSILLSTRTGGN